MKPFSPSVLLALSVAISGWALADAPPPSPGDNAPLMSLMERFAAAEKANPTVYPAKKPAASPSSSPSPTPTPTPTPAPVPAVLPGHGMAEHPMLYVGEWCRALFIVNQGKVIWSYAADGKGEYEDAWVLSNGNVLYARLTHVAMVSPEKKILWRYDAPKGVEIATCQPIGTDKVMFIENGKPPRLVVVNIATGVREVDHEIPYDLTKGSVHTQFRRARYTPQGTYLIAFMKMDQVVEYDKDFKEIWRYDTPTPCAVTRLKNGNTLVINEKDVVISEIAPDKSIVWQLKPTDLPEELRYTYAKSCTRLANGNTIICTQVGRNHPPQLVEVTKDKKVIWMLRNWTDFGGSTAVQILDEPGIPEVPGDSQH